MPYYRKCPKAVADMAKEILRRYETHKPLLDAGVTVDFVFAFPDVDQNGSPINDALAKNGVKALGLAKIIPADRRAKGESDGEIKLDGPWWDSVDVEEQESVLDHELHHFSVVLDGQDAEGRTIFKKDSNGRPKLRMRKHDVEVGWFKVIAERHGKHSQEQIQAAAIMDNCGQFFWPTIFQHVTSPKPSRTARLELSNA